MFICYECAQENKIDDFSLMVSMVSYGECEICNKIADCYDIRPIRTN